MITRVLLLPLWRVSDSFTYANTTIRVATSDVEPSLFDFESILLICVSRDCDILSAKDRFFVPSCNVPNDYNFFTENHDFVFIVFSLSLFGVSFFLFN